VFDKFLPLVILRVGFPGRLILDSRVLGDQELNERTKQRFASLSDIGHKLEETQGKWEFLL
jgi:hypothetical protein